jgi:hypothetical protein
MDRPNPGNNIEKEYKIKRAMYGTREQMDAATETIIKTDDPRTKADLQAKNERRSRALREMEAEMKRDQKHSRDDD